MRYPALLIGVALLSACSQAQDDAAADAPASESAAAAEPAGESAAKARKVVQDNEMMNFEYSYPAQAAAIPGLKAMLESDIAAKQEATRQGTMGEQEMAKEDPSYPVRRHEHITSWAVVTDIPGWLSLSAERWEYTGGAHGNPWFEALLWDKVANVKRSPMDLFTSKRALDEAIAIAVCRQIDAQREKKRGEPINPDRQGSFEECVAPSDTTIILGSSDGKKFDRIGALIAPYLAGPYAEGSYEATVPVNRAVLDAIKPEYRQYFAEAR